VLGLSFRNSLRINDFDLAFCQLSRQQCLQCVDLDFGIEWERVNFGLRTVGLSSLEEMGSSLVTHSSRALSLLRSHLNARSVGHGSVPSDFGVELIQVDPEVIEAVDEVPAQWVVEDVFRQF
jgi:hypothetical protein